MCSCCAAYPHNCDVIDYFPRSMIKSIKAERGQLTEGDELESVGVSVSDFVFDGRIDTRLYDLAGQVDYYGLHQLFLTSPAVYVLTWDAAKFLEKTPVMMPSLRFVKWSRIGYLRQYDSSGRR